MKEQITNLLLKGLEHIAITAACDKSRVVLEPTKHKSHGDYATNAAMVLAPQLKMTPRELAQILVTNLPKEDFFSKVEIAGPGFINFTLDTAKVQLILEDLEDSDHLGVFDYNWPTTVVVDLSSPNLAKEMHVGHLRSTILGDSVARVIRYLGSTVILQNHVGDWGTQFGMLLAQMELSEGKGEGADLKDLEAFYVASKKSFDSSPEFADRARELVVALQSGDVETLKKWQEFRDVSLSHCQAIYERLNVQLTDKDVKGESFYNPKLPGIIQSLRDAQMLSESEGAQCVFLDGYQNKEGEPLPMIIQKAGGGYLYSTTDLAAIAHRSHDLHANRVLYFVDKRQSQHFEMVFKIAQKAGLCHSACELTHMEFGTMNGKDGRPFRSRDGGTVKLSDLLDEAQDRALVLVKSKNPDMDDANALEIAKVVGVAAVKYADLSKHRASDYVFDFDQMLSFEGNTAPYLLYAYTRCAGIFRKTDREMAAQVYFKLVEEQEIDLGKKLLCFGDILNDVAKNGTPHVLCNYLYEVASLFSSFYEHCPILSDKVDKLTLEHRLSLVSITGKTLKEGLSLLGINVIERM